MNNPPFQAGDILVYTGKSGVSIGPLRHGEHYTCTGCKKGTMWPWVVGLAGQYGGKITWNASIFELVQPSTVLDDECYYQEEH